MSRLKLLSLLSCIVFMSSCSPWEMYQGAAMVVEVYPEDNPLEEYIEEELKEETGIDLDLSFWDDDM